MRTCSSSNFVGEPSMNPPYTSMNTKHRNRRRSKQRVEPFSLEESPVVTMSDQHTMAELLCAPTEGYAEAIVVPPFLAEHFELKHNRHWLEKEPPYSILTWEDLVSKFINEFFPPSRTTNLRNEIFNFEQRFGESFHEAWDRYKDLLRACPHHRFTELHQLDTFYNALNSADQDSLNSAVGGNVLERSTRDVLTIIENKSKQTSDVTTAMTAILKQFQATPPPASVKAVEEICVTCGGAHPYYQCLAADGNPFPELRDNIQGYVAAAAGNYNQGNSGYRPPGVANQTRPLGFAQQNVQNNQNRFSQPQGYNRGNNFNQNATYQAPIKQNQSVPLSELEKIKKTNKANMKAMQNQINNMNTASTSGSGSLPSNTVANPKGKLKAITTRSGLVLDGPFILMPPRFINPEEDERVEETIRDLEHGEFTIKVPPHLVPKAKPPSQRNYVVRQRDPHHPHIPYPSRMNQEKQKEKDEVQIHKFWQMFKQLHINITLADALILIPKYQKMLKSLLSNKEKLIELANTPLNENCSVVILKKLPEKLGDPGKFLIPCGFSELKCKALADLGASIKLMPLLVWKKLGLPELIPTQMTLELANREICTPVGIARDVFVPVGKFTFPADFVIVDYESDPCVPSS
ncbi:reverse transcriptase domain-containing protein [Tanacetum coccineum]|uniref:Reverse transcriptase domain-containing protein n=1 Tax=Tanacetum coccineum TaxID=301880 RepID=A0ABQ5GZE6_9ASTR